MDRLLLFIVGLLFVLFLACLAYLYTRYSGNEE